ncbi:hypothetical protein DQ237_12270 [Blastococcus sp. TF02-8]|uniref:hypothetical protein n=1 Tax=Blastococcus sp. TF02-8 TaxID=2250574 RepID=UPI000DE91BEB|nr:hypothetical protein [Blastococcus sp. TF02-8]RBY95908.1 hypothetical protein DQ237_12270 [Blastococcus sp. TF02-8]
MSVKLQQRPRTVRRPVDHERSEARVPPAEARGTGRPKQQPSEVRVGLIGLGVIAAVLLAFTAMVLLTALAGGDTFLG